MEVTYQLWQDRQKTACYVLACLALGGRKKHVSTKLKVAPEEWDYETCQPTSATKLETFKAFDARLDGIIKSLAQPSIEAVKLSLKNGERAFTLASALSYLLADIKTREIKESTLKVYQRFDKHCRTALATQGLLNVATTAYTRADFKETYQVLRQKFDINPARKIISQLRQAFTLAREDGLIGGPNPTRVKFKAKDEMGFQLQEFQVASIAQVRVGGQLERVRRNFLLVCWSGASYEDVEKIRPENVIVHEGVKVLIYHRKKNGETASVPVLPELEALWAADDYFKRIYNQDANTQLKTIAALAHIPNVAEVTFHCGRRTFGQILIDRGYQIEAVSAALGHTNIATTQKWYARPGATLVAREHRKAVQLITQLIDRAATV